MPCHSGLEIVCYFSLILEIFFLTTFIFLLRVIYILYILFTWQRILEHCKDPKTQDKVMDEILGSVSMLAQDQYGNYVVQVSFFS